MIPNGNSDTETGNKKSSLQAEELMSYSPLLIKNSSEKNQKNGVAVSLELEAFDVQKDKNEKDCKYSIVAVNGSGKVVKPAPSGCRRFLGLSLGLAASFAFSLAMLCVKLLTNHHPASIGVWRFTGIFVPSIPVLIYCRYGMKKLIFDPIWPMNQPAKIKMTFALLGRGILGCAAIILQYYSITFMELGDSTVISFSTPVFVSLMARIFLGEKCGVVPIFTAILTLFGVVIIARPPLLTGEQEFNESILIGTILSFTSMIFATIVFVILRFLREVHFILVTSTFGFIGIIQCAILCVIVSTFDLPNSPWEWFLGLSLATLTFIGQTFITSAFKFEQAGPVALTRTFDVVFAFIWQFIFLGVQPDIYSILGSTIVILGVVLIGIRKGLSTLSEDHPTRIKYWFLLK